MTLGSWEYVKERLELSFILGVPEYEDPNATVLTPLFSLFFKAEVLPFFWTKLVDFFNTFSANYKIKQKHSTFNYIYLTTNLTFKIQITGTNNGRRYLIIYQKISNLPLLPPEEVAI